MLTREDTVTAKGLAVCLMLVHHLYPWKDRMTHHNFYVPLLVVYDLENHLGHFAKICVSMFLFLSGYGLYLGYKSRGVSSLGGYVVGKVGAFYRLYWLNFVFFVPLGLLFFRDVTLFGSRELRYTLDGGLLVKNFLGIASSFNDEWWFAGLYLTLLMTLYPLYMILLENLTPLFILVTVGLYVLGFSHTGLNHVLHWQFSMGIGMFTAKHRKHLASLRPFLASLGVPALAASAFAIGFSRHFFSKSSLDFLLAPLLLVIAVELLAHFGRLRTSFACLGRYSFHIWLCHSFFCYYYFQDAVYFLRYSPAVFFVLLIFSLFAAVLLERSRKSLELLLQKPQPLASP